MSITRVGGRRERNDDDDKAEERVRERSVSELQIRAHEILEW